jgi:hypothetical protein
MKLTKIAELAMAIVTLDNILMAVIDDNAAYDVVYAIYLQKTEEARIYVFSEKWRFISYQECIKTYSTDSPRSREIVRGML